MLTPAGVVRRGGDPCSVLTVSTALRADVKPPPLVPPLCDFAQTRVHPLSTSRPGAMPLHPCERPLGTFTSHPDGSLRGEGRTRSRMGGESCGFHSLRRPHRGARVVSEIGWAKPNRSSARGAYNSTEGGAQVVAPPPQRVPADMTLHRVAQTPLTDFSS